MRDCRILMAHDCTYMYIHTVRLSQETHSSWHCPLVPGGTCILTLFSCPMRHIQTDTVPLSQETYSRWHCPLVPGDLFKLTLSPCPRKHSNWHCPLVPGGTCILTLMRRSLRVEYAKLSLIAARICGVIRRFIRALSRSSVHTVVR